MNFDPCMKDKTYLGGVLGIEVNEELQPISEEGIVSLEIDADAARQYAEAAAASAEESQGYRDEAQNIVDSFSADVDTIIQSVTDEGTTQVERVVAAGQTAIDTAAQSASQAQESASQASTSATQASTSATNAATSETNAAASATAAQTAQTAAETAQTAAETAQDAAETAETNAAASATAAATSATNAASSASQASASRTAAAQSATEAATSAESAEASATQAQSYISAPLKASTASEMTDETRIYVYVGSESGYTYGDWYYFDGSAWADGGAYLSSAPDVALSDTSTNAVQNRAVSEALSTKAEIDGYYDEMAVGSAEQLISTVVTVDQEPYNYRTSGGTADIGNRVTEKVVGGTVGWNQLAKPLDSTGWQARSTAGTVAFADGVATVTPSSGFSGIAARYNLAFVADHVYLEMFEATATVSDVQIQFFFEISGVTSLGIVTTAGSWTGGAKISKCTTSTTRTLAIREIGDNISSSGGTFSVRKAMFIDLTALFGTTIADQILALENATAGAGVALFRKLYPLDYYEYDAGSLQSVQTSGKRTVGFNQWDEEWELGYYNSTTGLPVASTTQIRSKNPIRVLPSTEYYIAVPETTRILYYDSDDNLISSETKRNATFTTPDNAWYIRLNFGATYGATYNHDICINLSWSGYRNGEYEPYESHSYPMSPITLRGIPKWDSAKGEIYYDGDTYESDGTVTRRYGVVDLGSLTWAYISTAQTPYFYSSISVTGVKALTTNLISTIYQAKDSFWSTAGNDMCMGVGTGRLNISNSAYTDPADFKTAMSGVMLVYELATPTTETADPYTNPQIVDDFGTEEFIDYAVSQGNRDVAIPVGHYSEYLANLRDKLQHLPDLADEDGEYVITQSDHQMSLTTSTAPGRLTALEAKLPDAPTTDGTYVLKVTVSDGTPTYAWVAE